MVLQLMIVGSFIDYYSSSSCYGTHFLKHEYDFDVEVLPGSHYNIFRSSSKEAFHFEQKQI